MRTTIVIALITLVALPAFAQSTSNKTLAATLNVYCCRPRAPAPWRALFGELVTEWLGAREVTA